ncbi:monosaccharide ABC transporter ATP-binding protein (CUT2 family) [Sediminihabitans luteus]|uniref:Monosaccharide ABC transporter ATP-binding protein (CUT2 family) n=1 Tax=Sediminihabitans luteus TaxID=1138585 RepID=A0A2M9CEW0_9CELL|nr:ATP-binding cassette domain-containing protein [Sediminihabitans luteus]PJJ70471.1 monosaccharide ABC transporter ATP-binding protein (CUT2 family) [Sediminihabitans luteus]GII97944.1 ABC transporter ATP-binding protein [Sediminihabitans luteus]
MTSPVLELSRVSKSFGAARALIDVDLAVHPREVVAVVGDNGAGKSTLAGVLAGVYPPDAGEMRVDGEPVRFADPGAARARGIATVFQELALCDNLDVVENLFLGHEPVRGALLDEIAMERRAWELLDQLGASVPSVRVPVAALTGGQRRTVAIARGLLGDPRVVVLDEPTASLGIRQTAELLNLVERLRERGHSVVFVSHATSDVQAVADRIVVLRLGRVNGEFEADAATSEDLLAAMTGARPVRRGGGR